jgi:DNA helicase-2/ATP-dependent DNA helicase PcrA
MDAIELARQEAEALHVAAVAMGSDIRDVLNLVLNQADQMGVDVYSLDKGSEQLKGGRAVYDSQGGMILYEDCGTDFEKAFLVAHEIGHIILEGQGEDFVVDNVDPLRPVEEPAEAVEKVLGYGGHERREVLMDIFAREFLLPRSILRDLHIDGHLSSIDIASRLNAPIFVVQQQLIDALLLPPCEKIISGVEKLPVTPDDSQRNAAAHRDSPYQLQAGPGTGKTATLVRRIVGLLEEGIDPSTILVLTFSNKAAGELRERVAAKVPESAPSLWIGTFHSFGLDIVHKFHNFLSLSNNPSIISRYEAIELLENELANIPLKHYQNLYDPTLILNEILKAISRAKDEVADANQYKTLAEDMLVEASNDDEVVLAEKCLEVAEVYLRYECLLKKHDSVDFGDLVLLPVTLVESNKDVKKSLSEQYQHILVDEYQDVNRASVRLLKAISGSGDKLWVVGDSRQSIYRFRGASSINMKRFIDDFPGACTEQLSVNYRSVNEVVKLYSIFSESMEASATALPLNLSVNRGTLNVLPELRVAGKPDDEIAEIISGIEEKKKEGFSYGQQAVLCTSNTRLSDIAKVLELKGIPVLYLGSLFERSEIKDLLSLMSLLVDKKAQGFVRAARLPDTLMRLEDLELVNQYLDDKDIPVMGWVDIIDDINELSEDARKSLKVLALTLQGFSKNDSPWSVLATLVVDRLNIAQKIYQSDSLKDKMKGIAIWQLLNFCRKKTNGKGLLIDRLLFRIRRLVLLSEDRDMRQLPQSALSIEGVRLMTIHASKGLEFDVVHLPGMNSMGLPASYRPLRCLPPNGLIEGAEEVTGANAVKLGHDEEEECKFFVATSRARDQLILYASSVFNNGNKRSRSKYIARVEKHLNSTIKPSMPLVPIVPEVVSVNFNKSLLITEKQLSLYDKCPRRFFYTYCLKTGGKRTETAFMKMHNVVYDVMDWAKTKVLTSDLSLIELEEQFQKVWLAKGPADHGYTDDYQRIGHRLIEYLMETREGKTMVKPDVLNLSFNSGDIQLTPDEVVVDEHGTYTVRKIRTGKKSKAEFDNIEYSILQQAVKSHFGGEANVEAVHLAGETQEIVSITEKKKNTRLERSNDILAAITKGLFPPKPESRVCPTCPSFVNEVVKLYSIFSESMEASATALPLNLSVNRGTLNVLPELRVAGKPDDEIAEIISGIEEKKKEGFSYGQQAVLCTSNTRLSDIAKVLELKGIPVLYLGSLFERSEIKDLLSLMSLLVDKKAQGFVRAARLPDTLMRLEDLELVNQYLDDKDIPVMGWVDIIDDINELSEDARKSLKVLALTLQGFSKNDSPWSVLATLVVDRLNIAQKIYQSDSLKDKMKGIAIWQLLNFCRKKTNGKGLLIDRLLFRIRRLVLLSEDRDMRQLPQSALSIEGVRLMTIHASKGLEFDVVHLPGMNSMGLPASYRPLRCLPPNGLIEGAEEVTGANAVKLGHDEEEECKFFVATSRARDQLILYASSVFNNGNKRSRSKYIARVEKHLNSTIKPSMPLVPIVPEVVSVNFNKSLLITEKQLSLYDKCPRRFFYTYCLKTGGKRTETAFMKMHNVVYDVMDWAKTKVLTSDLSLIELEEQFQKVWLAKGPADHGYTDDYQRIGHRLIEYLMETREGKTMVKPDVLNLSFNSGDIQLTPDEVVVDEHGTYTVRKIRTGKKSKAEFDNIEYSILQQAVKSHFGGEANVEAVHLAGETQEIVSITEKKKNTRLERSNDILAAITKGLFPPKPESRVCPTCPSFFICGDIPDGKITLKS